MSERRLNRTSQSRMPNGKAAPRDASWWRKPNVDSSKAVHAAYVDGDIWYAACGVGPLDETLALDVKAVRADLRCRRNGCVSILFES